MTTQTPVSRALLPAGLEDAWHARTVELPGGHLGWTGSHGSRGEAILTYHQYRCTAARIAFIIGNACEPIGQVKPGCDQPHCIHPDHVDDHPRRQRHRAALRTVVGTRPRPARCRRAGHDQAVHGVIRADGRHYCYACAHPTPDA